MQAAQTVAKWRSCVVIGKNTLYFSSAEWENGDLYSLPAAPSLRTRRDCFTLRDDGRDNLNCPSQVAQTIHYSAVMTGLRQWSSAIKL
jgi:hypothetical protein